MNILQNSQNRVSDAVICWVCDHDSRWSFILLYISTAVVAGIFANLFWVSVVMFCHLILELWRHRLLKTENAVLYSLWHTKLDFGLIMMGLAVAVYSDMIIGILGLSQAARGTAALGRVVVVQRLMRGFLLSFDEVGLLLRAIGHAMRKRCCTADDSIELEGRERGKEADPPWRKLTGGDWFSIGLAAASIVSIFLVPLLTEHGFPYVVEKLVEELTP